ncbi:hypothetical protein PRUB_a0984 [Pseudoalteromonas rubra]|uniref:Uncharacterized protein n=1 Tax=Pseudoalteromonas rubra TaxID=43658 RepID=A0A8T0C6Q6_9GAMM|nr:hypothetical protein [Pseudoalteromonas rubra]KAF7786424.1 hypothetical protein PRUB_a0984 [Pseudoalteromonas rubra]
MSHQLAARIAGFLFLISTSSYMYADTILSPLLRLPDFLIRQHRISQHWRWRRYLSLLTVQRLSGLPL